MAQPTARVSVWVGDPERADGDAAWCPTCMVSSLIQVPFYTYTGNDVFNLLMGEKGMLSCFRRFACPQCGYQRTEPA
jgi:hypothetical protein